jgi:hypothetical protein
MDCLTIEDESTVHLEHGNCLGRDSGFIPEGLYAQKFLSVENYY